MDKTPEEQYREELKKRLTEKPPQEETVFYSRTGFRKTGKQDERPAYNPPPRPRRRLGPALMIPLLLIFMMAGRLWSVVIPLALGAALYYFIKSRR